MVTIFLHRDIALHLIRQVVGKFKLNKAAFPVLLLSVPKEVVKQERILNEMNKLRRNHIIVTNYLEKLKSKKADRMQELLTGVIIFNDTEVPAP